MFNTDPHLLCSEHLASPLLLERPAAQVRRPLYWSGLHPPSPRFAKCPHLLFPRSLLDFHKKQVYMVNGGDKSLDALNEVTKSDEYFGEQCQLLNRHWVTVYYPRKRRKAMGSVEFPSRHKECNPLNKL